MSTELKTGALTTLERMKTRLDISVTGKDKILERLIDGATDFIESATSRTFLKATYIEKISVPYRGQTLIFTSQAPIVTLTSIKYKAGTPGTPNYTNLLADQYEIDGDGKAGIIRIHDTAPYGVNSLQVTYDAGYLIDFTEPTNRAKHTLPFDLTELCEIIVSRKYKRIGSEGKTQENGAGGDRVIWSDVLNEEDKQTIARYARSGF